MNEYLINNGKAPITKIEDCLTYEDVKNCDSYSYVLKKDEILVDIDNKEDGYKVVQMMEDLNISCDIRETERGYHFLFLQENNDDIPAHSGVQTFLGIKVDYKSGKRNGNECQKKDGKERELIRSRFNELDTIPYFLKPFERGDEIEKIIARTDEGCRNNNAYIIGHILNESSMPQTDIRLTMSMINKYLISEPMDQKEVMTIQNSVLKTPASPFIGVKKVEPNMVAEHIREKYSAKFYNGEIYLYDDEKGYQCVPRMLENYLLDAAPNLSKTGLMQACNYMDIRCGLHHRVETEQHIIQCKNGLINLYTGEMKPFTPGIFSNIDIPVYYDPNASSEEVEKALMKYANYDPNIYRILLEFIAYIFFPKNPFKKVFILTGCGSNGKTVFTQIIQRFVGRKNCSALPLNELNHQFKVSALASSLCNIGGDIGDQYIEDSAPLKAITGNDVINADRKFREPIEFECRSKLIFNCNKLPPVKDKSYALYNRLVIVPFTYDFDKDSESYSFDIEEFCSQKNMSALLNLVIQYYKDLWDNGKFTMSKNIIDTLLTYMCTNDNVAKYYISNIRSDENYEPSYLDYITWCGPEHERQVSSMTYNINISNIIHFYKNLMKQIKR